MTLISVVQFFEKTLGDGWIFNGFNFGGAIGVACSKGLLQLARKVEKFEREKPGASWERKALTIAKLSALVFAALLAAASMTVLVMGLGFQALAMTMIAPGVIPVIVNIASFAAGVFGFFSGAIVVNDSVVEIKKGFAKTKLA